MNVTYIVEVSPEHKTGLYNAIDNRIVGLEKITVINIRYYDGWLLSKLKVLIGGKRNKPLESFELGGVNVVPLNVKQGLLCKLYKAIFRKKFLYKDISKIATRQHQALLCNTDVFVAHWGMAPCTVARRLSNIFNAPVVNVFHGSDVNTKPLQFPYFKKELIKNILHATNNIFVSQKLKESALSLVGRNFNYAVVNNGAKVPSQLSDTTLLQGLDLNGKYIISFVGNHLPVKGADLLPQIINYISKNVENVHFIIAGTGGLSKSIQSMSPNNTTFTGMVDKIEALKIIKNSDVLMVPSRNEGFPLVIAEALCLGTKVVATDVGGISEVLDKEFLVNIDQGNCFSENFAKKVLSVLVNNVKQSSLVELDWDYLRDKEFNIIKSAYQTGK